MKRRAASYKECRDEDDKRDESGPKRKHVEDRESHIRRADLNGQKVIPEPALRSRGQHEKHHDGAVHGQQTQVSLRLDIADQRQGNGWPDQVNAHQQGQEHSHENCRKRQEVILQPDHLVIEAENIFADKALRSSVRVN